MANVVVGVCVYLAAPLVLVAFPTLLKWCIYVPFRFLYGGYKDLSTFALFKISPQCARNFYLTSAKDHTQLGAWHILPNEADYDGPTTPSENEFNSRLGDGNDIFLYLHGNAHHRAMENRVAVYKLLSKLGFHVVTIDYRGFGDSAGSPGPEEGIVNDALAALNFIHQNAPESRIFLWGHSLGTGIAASLYKTVRESREVNPISGILLDAPFDDLGSMIWLVTFPLWLVPYLWIVIQRAMKSLKLEYDSKKNLLDATVPITIIHSKDDCVVPFPRSKNLFNVLNESRRDVRFFDLGWNGYGHKHNYSSPRMKEIIEDLVGRAAQK